MSAQPATISCAIADDHPPRLEFLSRYLSNRGLRIAASARDGDEALRKIRETHPDVAVLDARMPRLSGLEVTRALAAEGLQTRVVLYTGYRDRSLLAEAVALGVAALLDEDSPLDDLVRAIEVAAAGGVYVDPGLGGLLLHRGAPGLTRRERDVLLLLADGLANDAIAERLGISPQTVRTHVQKAMTRLGATTRTQAVATALRRALIA